jgi:hypothetical protein
VIIYFDHEKLVAYQRSMAEYRKALTELNFRSGRLLETYNITLAEGIWDPKAYRAFVRLTDRLLGVPREIAVQLSTS